MSTTLQVTLTETTLHQESNSENLWRSPLRKGSDLQRLLRRFPLFTLLGVAMRCLVLVGRSGFEPRFNHSFCRKKSLKNGTGTIHVEGPRTDVELWNF